MVIQRGFLRLVKDTQRDAAVHFALGTTLRREEIESHDETAARSREDSWITRGTAARVTTHGGGPAIDHVARLSLDVHKDTIAVAILRPDQHAPDERSSRTPPE